MDIYSIPITDGEGEEKFILYRPLKGVAFVGNRAMAELAHAFARGTSRSGSEAEDFLDQIGFLEPDPPAVESIGPEFRPSIAVLLLTNRCSLRCVYCYASAGDLPRQELSAELGKTAIDFVCASAQEQGKDRFEVSFHGGGEPTVVWKRLEEFVKYARQQPIRANLTLTSNGVWSQQKLAWILANMDGISLSMDGGQETQDRQRPLISGKGSFKTVMRTITELDRRAYPYGIRMTATAPWSSMPGDVRFLCEETACPSIQVEPAFNTIRSGHGTPGEAEAAAFIEAFLEAFDIAQQAGRRFYYSGARLGVITDAFCKAPYEALIVNPSGELVTCYEVTDSSHPLAELSIIGGIRARRVEVDQAARMRLQARMAERRAACRECFCYWSCAGNCYTRAFVPGPQGHQVHGVRCDTIRTITAQLLLRAIAESDGLWRRPAEVTPDPERMLPRP